LSVVSVGGRSSSSCWSVVVVVGRGAVKTLPESQSMTEREQSAACSLDLDELAGSVRYSTLPQIISSCGMTTLDNSIE
jgi:hypothetical protein